ncbi:MAG: DUF1835 domain-containing protein [Rhodothermales bacterium]
MLHITQGDATVDLLRQAGMQGPILPWRDILHEGPVPAGSNLEALQDIRARFLSTLGWGTVEELMYSFTLRDRVLRRFPTHDEVLLWFEHDLYDQLHIAQILDWFARQDLGQTRLTMICIDSFPGVIPFRGLGDLTPRQIGSLFEKRQPITQEQLALAVAVWAAFRSPDPTKIEDLLSTDMTFLPFMATALRRHLQQFPSTFNGLGRTEHKALTAVAAGINEPVALFRAHLEQEEHPFLGDWTFWTYLKRLADGPHPLLRIDGPSGLDHFVESTITLTGDGRDVLSGTQDCVHLNGIDRWLGGVHLKGIESPWRWDETARCLRPGTPT